MFLLTMMHGVFLTLEVTSTQFTFLVRPGKLSSDRSQKNDEGKKISVYVEVTRSLFILPPIRSIGNSKFIQLF